MSVGGSDGDLDGHGSESVSNTGVKTGDPVPGESGAYHDGWTSPSWTRSVTSRKTRF